MADQSEWRKPGSVLAIVSILLTMILWAVAYFHPSDPTHPATFDFFSRTLEVPFWLEAMSGVTVATVSWAVTKRYTKKRLLAPTELQKRDDLIKLLQGENQTFRTVADQDVKKLNDLSNTLTTERQNHEVTVKKIQDDIAMIADQRLQKQKRIDELEKANKALVDEYKRANDSYHDMLTTAEGLRDKLTNAERELQNHTRQEATLWSTIKDGEKTIKQLQEVQTDLNNRIAACQRKYTESDARSVRLEGKLTEAEAKYSMAGGTKDFLIQKVKNLEKEVQDKDLLIQQLQPPRPSPAAAQTGQEATLNKQLESYKNLSQQLAPDKSNEEIDHLYAMHGDDYPLSPLDTVFPYLVTSDDDFTFIIERKTDATTFGLYAHLQNQRLDSITKFRITLSRARSYSDRRNAFRETIDFKDSVLDLPTRVPPDHPQDIGWIVRKAEGTDFLVAGHNAIPMVWPPLDPSKIQKWSLRLRIEAFVRPPTPNTQVQFIALRPVDHELIIIFDPSKTELDLEPPETAHPVA